MSRAVITGLSREQGSDPSVLYYDATIINNTTSDLGVGGFAVANPQIRFNETRDVPLVKDTSKYQFSIVRFSMDGPNRDLPLFIPNIQTGQSDVNLTSYSVSMTFQQTWQDSDGNTMAFVIIPPQTFIEYVPENMNPLLAPTPAAPTTKQDITTRYYWLTCYHSFGCCSLKGSYFRFVVYSLDNLYPPSDNLYIVFTGLDTLANRCRRHSCVSVCDIRRLPGIW